MKKGNSSKNLFRKFLSTPITEIILKKFLRNFIILFRMAGGAVRDLLMGQLPNDVIFFLRLRNNKKNI